MKRYGYARVSSTDQDLTIQRRQLTAAGCDVILAEKVSGKSRDGRAELRKIMDVIGTGDVLVVTKYDRLGRNLLDLLMINQELAQKGADLISLAEKIDTTTHGGKMLFYVSGISAEIERDRIRERQREGIERRKAEGGYHGRPPSFDAMEIRRLAAEGLSKSRIARQLGCHRSTVHRALEAPVS
jgi:DNA invertase Pin-like site-specific DNA recombinase